jgi:hypothetical protein
MFAPVIARRLNKIVGRLHKTQEMRLQYPRLDVTSLRMVVYCDSSLANNLDGSTQLGHLIALADASGSCSILAFRSYKAKRIVRSSTAGETLALADAFDASCIVRKDIEMVLQQSVPMLLLTDSEVLFSTLARDKYAKERRLLLDIAAVRQAYQAKEISNIGLIASKDNSADALTKENGNGALMRVLQTGQLLHQVQRWIIGT